MKNLILIKSFALSLLLAPAAFAVNDNVTSTVYNTPQAGSLTSNQEANNNSASNNGMIGTSSSATANTLHSDITGIQRFDTSNNQLGNSYSTSSLGNISNNSAGGAGGSASSSSGGNSLSNSLTNSLSSNSGGNTLSNGQGQSSTNTNTNTSSGNSTQVNAPTTINQSSVTKIPRQAPALPGQVNVQAPGTSGGNFALSTPFGGAGFGLNRTVAEMKTLFLSQAEQVNQIANSQYIENIKAACEVVSESECLQLKAQMLRKLGVRTANKK
jgi:hypothetical protein